jgi:hypothetical protein
MIAATDPVHVCGIQYIAPLVKQCAVSPAIHGYLAVAMEFAACDAIGAIGARLIFANGLCPIYLHALPCSCGGRSLRLGKRNHGQYLVAGAKIEFLAPEFVVVGILRPVTLAHDGARGHKFAPPI